MIRTDLLVIGAGPYASSAAADARDHGIDTHVVGIPMAFWRDHMPSDMYLRSGTDWHLDAGGEHTFAAYVEDRGLDAADLDPVPIDVFLDHTDWFAEQKSLDVDQRLVASLDQPTPSSPPWRTGRRSPPTRCWPCRASPPSRTCPSGRTPCRPRGAATRVLCDHGAESVDVVHRHPTPAFERVSWAFVDDYVDQTLAVRGWWRDLPAEHQQGIALEFWTVGRLTLEHWLTPRLRPEVVTSHPGCSVDAVVPGPGDGPLTLTLSDGQSLEVDHVVFASGYRADLGAVPYLSGLLDRISVTDGSPDLSSGFETSLPGLFVTGFASTRDFGPFYRVHQGLPVLGADRGDADAGLRVRRTPAVSGRRLVAVHDRR